MLAAWLLVACGDGAPSVAPETALVLPQGEIVGTSLRDGSVHAWRGIPFAEPPVGELRWRAPLAPRAWDGPREALASGSMCTQLGGDPLQGSEDCLYLDVFAPADAREGPPLPVMFWIHGGGNTMGAGDQLDASRLAGDERVVVVTVNYRLGVFGWFSHPALAAQAARPLDASGNFGTLDLVRALEWTRDNVAHFGGNPGQVTIFGESAGGINVFSLLLSPLARGLFHAAIAESGVPATMSLGQAVNYADDPEPTPGGSSSELLVALLVQAGRAADRDEAKRIAAAMSDAEIVAFLRGHDSAELLAPFVAAAGDSPMPIYLSPNVIRDGTVLPLGNPNEAFATRGAFNAVPFIAGTNRDENKLFNLMSSPHVSYTFGMPTGFVDERMYDLEGEYGGLTWRASGADQPIAAMHASGQRDLWMYRFDWDELPSLLGVDLSKLVGAAHGLELPFVFGINESGVGNALLYDDLESARELSRQIRSYWSNLAYTLAPGRGRGGDLPEWPAWNPAPEGPKYLRLDSSRDAGIGVETDRIDLARVVARVGEDRRLATAEQRCRIYRQMVMWSEALTPEAYEEVGSGECRDYPLADRVEFATLP